MGPKLAALAAAGVLTACAAPKKPPESKGDPFDSTRLVIQMGGMRLLVQKFVDMWGPADHAGESRWTWQRPMFQRRADFYAWPELSLLTITDMSLMPVVAQRLKRQDQKGRSKLEF